MPLVTMSFLIAQNTPKNSKYTVLVQGIKVYTKSACQATK
jgi:hypothetical protein